jgi:hypothetical protein
VHPVAGTPARVRLVKHVGPDLEYPVVVLRDDSGHLVVRGPWADHTAHDLGFVRFEPGDQFTEHYWRHRWYSVKEVRSAEGRRKGSYCDVARPVRIEGSTVISEDLDLDLWVSADGRTIARLDEDDFLARGLAQSDPMAEAHARAAIVELEQLALDRFAAIGSDEGAVR